MGRSVNNRIINNSNITTMVIIAVGGGYISHYEAHGKDYGYLFATSRIEAIRAMLERVYEANNRLN